MNLKIPVIAVAVFLGLAHNAQLSDAQGLKGARMPGKILGRLTYLPGVNDRERWKVFLDTQPKLVGMSLSDVCNHFGKDPVAERDLSAVEYGLTQEPVKSGSEASSWLHLKIYFRNGAVWKYTVEAVR